MHGSFSGMIANPDRERNSAIAKVIHDQVALVQPLVGVMNREILVWDKSRVHTPCRSGSSGSAQPT
jgi:hypothetical protein